MIILIGAKSPKNIKPKIIGLIILPSKIPNIIQSLLRGNSNSGFRIAVKIKIPEKVKNKLLNRDPKKYTPKIKKIIEKKMPNFLLEGNSISLISM